MFPIVVALTAAVGFAQDVVQVAPERVKVLFENDRVRVLRFSEPGHSKLPMHSHPAYVAVGFTADRAKYTLADSKTAEERTKAGEATYSESITHASEILTNTPSEAVMVELKNKPAGTPAAETALDPVKIDPKHYKMEIDNDRVRVLRIKYGPHEKSVMHEHPASVVVFLSDANSKFTVPDGTSQETNSKARDAQWADAGQHLPENLSDKPMEAVLIELKR